MYHGMKLEINDENNFGKFTNMWKLNKTFLNTRESKEKSQGKIRKLFEINENESTTYQNLCHAVKTVLRGKLIISSAYVKKKKDFQSII